MSLRPHGPCAQVLSFSGQGIGVMHLRALAELPRLTALNLFHVSWASNARALGLGWLAARLPGLRVLNAPPEVMVRSDISQHVV